MYVVGTQETTAGSIDNNSIRPPLVAGPSQFGPEGACWPHSQASSWQAKDGQVPLLPFRPWLSLLPSYGSSRWQGAASFLCSHWTSFREEGADHLASGHAHSGPGVFGQVQLSPWSQREVWRDPHRCFHEGVSPQIQPEQVLGHACQVTE